VQSCAHDWQFSLLVGWHVPSPQLACVMHIPLASQTWFMPHEPQVPPQASLPHCLPVHCLVQHALLKQVCAVVHLQSFAQLPQFSPV